MKKLLLFFIIFTFNILQATFASSEFEVFTEKAMACKWETNCHYNLTKEYSTIPAAKYYYAKALIMDKDYLRAKEILNSVLYDQNTDSNLKKLAQDELNKTKQMLKNIHIAFVNDYGNYVSDLDKYKIWKNPGKLKVFIKGDFKKDILKQAFSKWDYKLHQLVNFEYVHDEQQADIVCYYVDKLEGKIAGITHYQYIGEKMVKATIEVSLKDLNNNLFDDNEILSIALHEIGHALGIIGHSENLNDIMYYSTGTYKNGIISEKDVNTIMHIYNRKN
jgi:predicted Zn-dependent protease